MAKASPDVDEKTYTTQCSICCEKFRDPRILDCYHTFCFECMKEFIETSCKNGKITCPVCKDTMKVPMIGAMGLERNYYVGDKKNLDGRVPCDVCTEKNRAYAFCYECNQNLCSNCVGFHEKLQTTKDHHVAMLDETGARKISRKPKCATHSMNELQYFCEQCEELICIGCNMTSHKLHKCKDVGEVAQIYRQELSEDVRKEEYRKLLDELTNFSRNIKKQKSANSKSEDTLIASIEKQKKAFHKLIDEICYDFIDAISESGNDKEMDGKQQKTSLERKIHSFAAIHFFAKQLLKQADDAAVVTHKVNLRRRLDILKTMDTTSSTPTNGKGSLLFSPAELDKDEVKELFGKLLNPNEMKSNDEENTDKGESEFELIVEFTCSFAVTGIASTDDSTAWICMGTEALVQLFDISGKIIKQVTFSHGIDDVVFDQNGMLYVSSNSNKKIRTVNDRDEKGTLTRTELCCRGLAWDKDNKSVVSGLMENDVFFNVSDKDKAAVIHVGLDKRIRAEHSGNKDVKYPGRLVVCGNKVFISDWVSLCVIVQNSRGETENRYDGKPSSGKKSGRSNGSDFIPRGVCVDGDNNVYVADTESESIHMLNSNGEFQKKVLTKADGLDNPWWLDFNCKTKYLWVGSQEGTIQVYKQGGQKRSGSKSNDSKSRNSDSRNDSRNRNRDRDSRASDKSRR